ncbi:MAG: sigma-70 family RNA polymerase sigma factor [Miniphocaeibacter sp.]|uniref:sigma-70 family RNA polymerase sigma factor n=1 Tax=Miniphocaeibacter sp. TaxID=3100973 RepID=UPI003BB13F32
MVNLVEQIVKEKDISKAHIVVESYKPLLISGIKKYYNKANLFEDLLQEGVLEICQAILDFDESKNIPFSGYLKSRIYYFYLGKNNVRDDFVSLDEEVEGGENISLLDLITDKTNIEEDYNIRERNKILYSGLMELTENQRNIIVDFYFNKMSLKEIASKYGKSYRTIVNTKTNGLRSLKKFLLNNGNF